MRPNVFSLLPDIRYIFDNIRNKLLFTTRLRHILFRIDRADVSGKMLIVKGWAISRFGRHGVQAIEIYLNGTLVGKALYGTTRTDVQEAYPTIKDSLQSGFQFPQELPEIRNSENFCHFVQVKILGIRGATCSAQKICTYNISSQETGRLSLLPSPAVYYAWLEQSKSQRAGINIVADLRADFGLSDSARALVEAIIRSGFPVSYIETPLRHVSRTAQIPEGITQGEYYKTTLIHLNAPEMLKLTEIMPSRARADQYVIGYWYWELSTIPQNWHLAFKYLDEIWVASSFVQDAIACVAPPPVICIPPSINVRATHARREDFDLPDERFVFTYSFSPYSSVARKNPFAVIEAFRRAFGTSDKGPLLALKVHHLEKALPELEKPLYEAIEAVHGKLILNSYTRQEMYNYLSLCDCYVSLHRSEGFGLGIAESMALGKPVIATAYSGNTDFMRLENSYLVTYKLREVTPEDHEHQPDYNSVYPPGFVWAEPDIDHAAELMNKIYENQQEARHMGQKAQKYISHHYSPAAQARMVRQRLNRILQFT